VTVDEYIEGRGDNARQVRRVRFKLAPKQPALEKIGIELGMFVTRTDISIPERSASLKYLPRNAARI